MDKKKILFIEVYSTVMIYKIAKLFKDRGYETILIRLLEQNKEDKDFYDTAFDEVVNFNISHSSLQGKKTYDFFYNNFKNTIHSIKLLFYISKFKPYIVFGRAKPNIVAAFFRIYFRKFPFIYFPYDIISQSDPEYLKKNFPSIEIKSERFCFEKFDGIIHKGAPEELNPENINGRILGNDIKLPKYKLAFHPYCSKEFIVPVNKNKLSKKDGKMHFVYIGGISRLDRNFYNENFQAYKKIPENNIHIHFYFSYDTDKQFDFSEWKRFTDNYLKEFKHPKKKYFHIHPPLNPKKIVKEISKYDYGIASYEFLPTNGIEPNFSIGNKLSTYLEAGIPFIYRGNYLFMDRIMEKYNLSNIWPENMKSLNKKFRIKDFKKIHKSIIQARGDFLMEAHFQELENFIENVAVSFKK